MIAINRRMTWLLLVVLLATTGRAQEFEYQGLWYRHLSETTAEVAVQQNHQWTLEGDIVIPRYVEDEGKQLQVTGIGNNAFMYTKIASFTLDRVVDFGVGVFSGCRQLKRVSLPEGMTTLPDNTFYGCRQLTDIQLPSTLTQVDLAAFADCQALTSIDIPAGVTVVGASAFYHCFSLEHVTMGDQVKVWDDYCFYECSSLKDIHIPQQLEQVGMNCFANCTSLKRLDFPATMTKIGMGAFQGCTALQEVTFGDGVESIPDNCFSDCVSLKTFRMPSAVKSVKFRAFTGCGIESITLPEGIQSIESAAFNCPHLGEVVLKNPKMPIEWPNGVSSDAFSKPVQFFATLHVPEGCRAYYRAQAVWQNFEYMVEDNVSGKEYCELKIMATGISTVKLNDEVVNALLQPTWVEIEKSQPLKLTVLLDEGSTVHGATRYVASVRVNGEERLPLMEVDDKQYELTLDAVSEDLDIVVDIPWRSYAVTISQGSGGSIYVIPASKTRMDVKVTAADGSQIEKIEDYSSFWKTAEPREHDGRTGQMQFSATTADDHTLTIKYQKQ